MNIEHVWAAGFWDGEGCLSVTVRPGTASVPRIVAQIAQVDREVLDRFAAAIGIGSINGPYKQTNPNAQDYYCWRVEGLANLSVLKEAIYPYLGSIKRTQMDHGINTRKEWEDAAKCQFGHSLSQSKNGHWRCFECQSETGKKNMLDRWGDTSNRVSKVCSFCREDKALDHFSKMSRAKDGRQSVCRACMREYRKERQGG